MRSNTCATRTLHQIIAGSDREPLASRITFASQVTPFCAIFAHLDVLTSASAAVPSSVCDNQMPLTEHLHTTWHDMTSDASFPLAATDLLLIPSE